MGLFVEAGPPCISRRGKAQAIRPALALRLHGSGSSSATRSMPGAPPRARPSAESASPTRGEGKCAARKCVIP